MQAMRYLGGIETFPATMKLIPGEEVRTKRQNNLAFQWYKDAAEQGDQTVEEYRAYCKAWFGIPILCADDEDFRELYDRQIRPLPYETKLILMAKPFDFAVTREMNVKQMTKYLNSVWDHFTGKGYQLTDPALKGLEDYQPWLQQGRAA